jgi:hypothetical protein
MKPIWEEQPTLCFTADTDWASEPAICDLQSLFEAHEILPTYFQTHPSAHLSERLAAGRLHAGIHPNFMPGSSHGNSIGEVIDYCLALVPTASCFRSHRYFDVTDVTHGLYARGLRYDSNVCTLLQTGIQPFRHESGLVRFPTYFEDGTYLFYERSFDLDVLKRLFEKPGLNIISFHPMNLALNCPNLTHYRAVADGVSRQDWNQMSTEQLQRHRYSGRGIRDFVTDMLEHVRRQRLEVRTLHQLYEEYQNVGRSA